MNLDKLTRHWTIIGAVPITESTIETVILDADDEDVIYTISISQELIAIEDKYNETTYNFTLTDHINGIVESSLGEWLDADYVDMSMYIFNNFKKCFLAIASERFD